MKIAMTLLFLVLAAVAGSIAGCGKQQEPSLVAILMLDDFRQPMVDGLENGLGEYGHVAGDTICYKIVNAHGDQAALPRLAAELVELKPDVLIPVGGVEADACYSAARNTDIPIVFAGVSSPIARGLAKSPLEPRRYTTGVRSGFTDLVEKRLQLVSLFFPDVRDVTILYDPTSVPSRESLEEGRTAAKQFNFRITPAPVRNAAEIRDVMSKFSPETCPVLLGTPAALIFVNRESIIAPAAISAGVIFFGFDRGAVDEGAALAYGANYYGLGTQAARLVHKVLMGFKPESMPIEMPLEIGLAINSKTLKKLNVNLPAKVLGLADYVVHAEGDDGTIQSY